MPTADGKRGNLATCFASVLANGLANGKAGGKAGWQRWVDRRRAQLNGQPALADANWGAAYLDLPPVIFPLDPFRSVTCVSDLGG